MTANDFRRIALGMKDAIEREHMGHPDFRANGRIFATLHADLQWGMVKLTPEQQETFVRKHSGTFIPENGAWGRQGCTAVRLDSVDEETLGEALTLAWRNSAAFPAARRSRSTRKTGRTPSPRTR
jgi:YjbR